MTFVIRTLRERYMFSIEGERYILWTDTLSMRAFARILADEFNPQGNIFCVLDKFN